MYIKIRVIAGAKKEKFTKKSEDHFEVFVKEPALRNMANKRVLELVEGYFGPDYGKARIISGHHSPGKIVRIDKK